MKLKTEIPKIYKVCFSMTLMTVFNWSCGDWVQTTLRWEPWESLNSPASVLGSLLWKRVAEDCKEGGSLPGLNRWKYWICLLPKRKRSEEDIRDGENDPQMSFKLQWGNRTMNKRADLVQPRGGLLHTNEKREQGKTGGKLLKEPCLGLFRKWTNETS